MLYLYINYINLEFLLMATTSKRLIHQYQQKVFMRYSTIYVHA